MDGIGIYMSIKYLQDWKDLDDAQKAEAVISMVQFVVQTGSGLGSLIQMMRGKDPDRYVQFRIFTLFSCFWLGTALTIA